MIKNILFDCADTLLRFHSKDDLAEQLQSAERAARIHNAFQKSEIWSKYDNGLISEDEVLQAVLPMLDKEDRPIGMQYFDDFIHHFTPFSGMEDLLKELKEKGLRLYLVSDFPPKFTVLWEKYELFRLFDGCAVSFRVHGSKKDLRLFEYLLNTYGLDPRECLFVDDVAALVANGETFGIHGHVFRGVAELRAYLTVLSVL